MHLCTLKYWLIFFISSIKNRVGDDEVIFQDDKASYHRTKGIKAFFREKNNDMTCTQTESK